MAKPKPPCETIGPWLTDNLGNCLAPLTGSDARALRAAVQIIDQYSYDPSPEVLKAFGLVVGRMQETTSELAYHAIAHILNWEDRPRLWALAGLSPIPNPRRCKFES